jgi:hypothetical protein
LTGAPARLEVLLMAVMFDLDQVDKAAREDTLSALMSQIPVPIDVRSRSVDDLHVSTVSGYFGGVFLVSCNGRGALVERGEKRAKEDHTRSMMLSVVAAGRSRLQQSDRTCDIGTGDVIPYTSDRPYRATFDNVAKHTYMIEYSRLDLPERVLNAQLARRLNAGHALGTIVSRYLTELATNGVYLSDQDRTALERPTLDLLRALFASTSGDESLAREPLHASLGTRMIEYVKMHLREPDLNIARVAREHGISERYAYLILSKSGISLGQ